MTFRETTEDPMNPDSQIPSVVLWLRLTQSAALLKSCEAQLKEYSLYGHAYTQKLMHIYLDMHIYRLDRKINVYLSDR